MTRRFSLRSLFQEGEGFEGVYFTRRRVWIDVGTHQYGSGGPSDQEVVFRRRSGQEVISRGFVLWRAENILYCLEVVGYRRCALRALCEKIERCGSGQVAKEEDSNQMLLLQACWRRD